MAEGMLIVWTDVETGHEDDFEEWYNREHVNERAAIKGFLSGARYSAIRGQPRFLALYETRTPTVLSSKAYRSVLDDSTAWTKRVTSKFRNTTRGVFEVAGRAGEGHGGGVATLRIAPPAKGGARLARWLAGPALREVVKQPGMVRAEFFQAVEVTGPQGTGNDDRENRTGGLWAVVIDGADERSVAAALAKVLPAEALRRRGAGADVARGLYRLRYAKAAGGR